MPCNISLWQIYLRCYYIIQAISISTVIAYKMYVMILVMAFGTFIFTKSIADRIIRGGDGMDDSLIYKSLQCTVYCDPVKFFAGFSFNIAMRKRSGLFQEKLQYPAAAPGNT